MPEAPSKPALIVVNSLVASGGVGGRAALAVLERFGYPVWLAPTVVLAWHPGHGPATRMIPDRFGPLMADLADLAGRMPVAAVLSGYLGAPDQAADVASLVRAVREANPGALYLCDPVLGDAGRLYQPEATLVATRETLLPLADIATPNRAELEFLTGRRLADNAALADAAARLGAAEAIVTSAEAPESAMANLLVTGNSRLIASHPALAKAPHGTGDFFAAAYLGYRLSGLSPERDLAAASAATLRMVGIAVSHGSDELPLSATGEALGGGTEIAVTPLR